HCSSRACWHRPSPCHPNRDTARRARPSRRTEEPALPGRRPRVSASPCAGASISNQRTLTRHDPSGNPRPQHSMRHARWLLIVLVFVAGCASRAPQKVPPPDFSGFLDDYSMLHPGASGEVALVYRNPDAQWTAYDKVLFEPVTLWRSGKSSLDPVPEGDLL